MSALQELSTDFWNWRAVQQPRSHDDIPRLERPAAWIPDFSAGAVSSYRRQLAEFENRLPAVEVEETADEVDRRLLACAMARVHWELDVLRLWQREPNFYLDQTLGVVFDLLTPVDPDTRRLSDVLAILRATPAILDQGKANLRGHAVRAFAELTIGALTDVQRDLERCTTALASISPPGWTAEQNGALVDAGAAAGEALAAFRAHLVSELPSCRPLEPIGPGVLQWFLCHVALLPYTPDQLLGIGELETQRAVTLEVLERNRNGTRGRRVPPDPSFTDWRQQAAAEAADEQRVRQFYQDRGLLTQPAELRHYRTTVMPDYLEPISWLGVADDLTGPSRLAQNGSAFFPPPGPGLPYFYAANAHDPRAGIIHEGVHYQQLALSWRHPRPVRRHYYDSTPNEGIAFYNEEMMLASGLFDDAPTTREIVYNFMRLRALRVVVDVQLATGGLDIEGAARFLEAQVPMDLPTAREEAAHFAATPGQAMTYQVGKTQILDLLADAARRDRDQFALQAFHDRLWLEGNVPLALQRWELLGDDSALRRVDALAAGTARPW